MKSKPKGYIKLEMRMHQEGIEREKKKKKGHQVRSLEEELETHAGI